ncbi:MAG TPA: hypothetical protein VGA08_01915 [Candidatus Saccharimonadales bacterium]
MDQRRAKEYRDATHYRHVEELRAFNQIDEDPGAPEEYEGMTSLEKFEHAAMKLDVYRHSDLVESTASNTGDMLSDDAYRYRPESSEQIEESYRLPEIEIEPAAGNYGPLTLRIDVQREKGVLQSLKARLEARFIPVDMYSRLDDSLQPSGPPSNHGPMEINRDLHYWETVYRSWMEAENEPSPNVIKKLHQFLHSVEVYIQNTVIQPRLS